MSEACEKLQNFAHGELPPPEAEAFRGHLTGCRACESGLLELMQLDAGLQQLPEPRAPQRVQPRVARPHWAVRGRAAQAAVTAALLAVVTGATWLAFRAPRDTGPVLLAMAPTRSIEMRLSHSGAAAHRPYAVSRAAGSPTEAEDVPVQRLAELEARGDFHGLAVAHLLAGERGRAARTFAQAGASPDVESDHAALMLAQGDAAEALRRLEAVLARAPGHTQALWNRALALQRLGLTLAAAEDFDAIAARGEQGWAEEAGQRAAELRKQVQGRRDFWLELRRRGEAMVQGGPPLTAEDARRVPGMTRLFFYDAVRAAPLRMRVEELRPLAAALDAVSNSRVLEAYVARVAAADFTRRGPLAHTYAALAAGQPPANPAAYLALLERGGYEGQYELGATVLARMQVQRRARFHTLSQRSGDPWFAPLAASEEATALQQEGSLLEAEARLQPALERCLADGLDYRCAQLSLKLAQLYAGRHQLRLAQDRIRHAGELALRSGEWGTELQVLMHRADATRLEERDALAVAELREVLLRNAGDCRVRNWAHVVLTLMALEKLDPEEGARHYSQLASCEDGISQPRLHALSELVRQHKLPEAALQERLVRLRARSDLPPAERLTADHAEASVLLERDRAAGRALLERTVREADALPRWDSAARRVRAYGQSLLAVDAAGANEPDAALTAVAEGLEVPVPERCAIGFALYMERLAVVVRDARGVTRAMRHTRPAGALEPANLVPAELRQHLQECESMVVLTQPPMQGKSGVLPSNVAWSYRLSSRRHAPTDSSTRRLVVGAVDAPPSLGLPALSSWRTGGSAADVELTGAAATPSRVGAELAGASVAEFHVHGLVDLENADASALVLAPEADGRFTLRAADIRALSLRRSPLVLLVACHAAQTLGWQHQGWSLPAAFLEAGARAVLASTAQVPDTEAPAFFEAVRTRILSGMPPAVALREERVQWLERGQTWVNDVLLFE